MTDSVSATAVVDAPPDVVFAVLADPSSHAAIDGTGWVRGALDSEPITAAGQLFRVAMHHDGHPDGDYRMANQVQLFDPPRGISWAPLHYRDDGSLGFGGWIWRYDLRPVGRERTEVTLTYDWTAVPESTREYLPLPPFPPDHLANSLAHLAALATS